MSRRGILLLSFCLLFQLSGAIGLPAAEAAFPTLPFPVKDDHWPALAMDHTDTPWVTWISSYADTSITGSGDQVYAATWNGTSWDTTGIATPSGRYLDPRIIRSDTTMVIAWVELNGSDSNIFVRRFNGTWLPEQQITTSTAADFAPALAADSSGMVWLAWQTLDTPSGSYDIHAVHSIADTFSAPLVIADSPANDREPDVAIAPDGSAWFAWGSVRDRFDDVFIRRYDGISLGSPVSVTGTPNVQECYPVLSIDALNKIWIAYYRVNRHWKYFEEEFPGSFDTGSIQLICWDGAQVSTPYGTGTLNVMPKPDMGTMGYDVPTNPIYRFGVRPTMFIDSDQRLWIFAKMNGYYFAPAARSSFWGLYGLYYEGSSWSATPEIFIDRNAHYFNAPAVAMDASGDIWTAWTEDRRELEPLALLPLKYNLMGPDSDVLVDTFTTLPGIGTPLQSHNHKAPPVFDPGSARSVPRYTLDSGGETYGVYWGENHRHSCDFSNDGIWDYTAENSFSVSHERLGYDWYSPSDHIEKMSSLGWDLTAKFVDLLHIPGEFLTYAGYERSGRNGLPDGAGDHTVQYLSTDDFFSPLADVGSVVNWPSLYQLKAGKRVLMIPHHPVDASGYMIWPGLIEPGSDTLLTPLRLIEVFQTTRGSAEHPGCIYEHWKPSVGPDTGWVNLALDAGMRLGFMAAGDHNPANGFTAVLATDPTRESIFEAMEERRTYGTAFSRKMFVDFRINNNLMGSELISEINPTIAFSADAGADTITKVTIIKDGDTAWYTSFPNSPTVSDTFADPDPIVPGSSSYYYLRVEHADSGLAWSSPIWVDFHSSTDIAESQDGRPLGVATGLKMSPSPFRPENGRLSITLTGDQAPLRRAGIYDVSGRLVRHISLRNGVGEWNGRNDAGRIAGPGVYLVRAIGGSGGKDHAAKVTLVR